MSPRSRGGGPGHHPGPAAKIAAPSSAGRTSTPAWILLVGGAGADSLSAIGLREAQAAPLPRLGAAARARDETPLSGAIAMAQVNMTWED
jgi:hypothetical protein